MHIVSSYPHFSSFSSSWNISKRFRRLENLVVKMTPKSVTAEQFEKYLENCKGHDQVLKKVKIVKAGNGNCVAELKVEEEHVNKMQGLHGGLSAALVDVITSFGLFTHENCLGVPSVSVDLHVTYIKPVMVGEEIVIEATTLSTGKTLAYLDCQIKNKSTGAVVVKGSQTKYFIRPKE